MKTADEMDPYSDASDAVTSYDMEWTTQFHG